MRKFIYVLNLVKTRFMSALDKTEALCAGFGSCLLFVLVVWILIDVSARSLFRVAVGGSYEAGGLIMISSVFLGLAWVQAQDKHIQIELIVNTFPKWIQKIMALLTLLVGLILFSIIAVLTFFVTIRAWQSGWSASGIVPIPTWPAYAAVALGSFLLSLRYLTQIITKVVSKA